MATSTDIQPGQLPTTISAYLAAHAARDAAEFSYTTELIGAERVDDTHWVAVNRLEGDFPGGVAELRYRFTMDGDLVTELVIAS